MLTKRGHASARPAPRGSLTVDVFTWRLAAPQGEVAALAELLSAEERRRAARFAFAPDRDRFIVGRARLRQILARYVAQRPEALTFRYRPHGKPSLATARAAPFFNLSHSDDLAALAITSACDIGIDIERIRTVPAAVARRFFAANENAALLRLDGADWLAGFFRCWTRKEAVIKAVGKGLAFPLKSFAVSLLPGKLARVVHIGGCTEAGREWALADLTLGPGLAGAIAARTMGVRLSVRRRRCGEVCCQRLLGA